MKLDDDSKNAARDLGEAINRAIEKSARVANAIEKLRELGYEPHLNLKLEIGLQEVGRTETVDYSDDFELELTDEDLRTLSRMKIKIE